LIDPTWSLWMRIAEARRKRSHAVDGLYAVGRTDRPREVEDAVWQREAAY
jgi:hypothetical protein